MSAVLIVLTLIALSPQTQDPDPVELGRQALFEGRLDEAKSRFETAIAAGVSRVFEVYFALGRVYLEKRDFASAKEAFDRSLERAPRFGPSLLGRARARLFLGEIDPGLADLKAAEAAPNPPPEASILERQLAFYQSREEPASEAELRAVLARDLGNADAYLALGARYRSQKDREKAAVALRVAQAIDDQNPIGFLLLEELNVDPPLPEPYPELAHDLAAARSSLARGDEETASAAARRILARRPLFVPARLVLLQISESRGKTLASLLLYRDLLDQLPEVPALTLEVARVAQRAGAYGLAECTARRALAAKPADPAAVYFLLATAELSAEKSDRAIETCERAIDAGFGTAPIYYTLGEARHQRMDLGESISAFEKAVELDPKAAESIAAFALSSLTTEQYASLRNLLSTYVQSHPDSVNTLYSLGVMHARDGDTDKAVDYFRRANALAPGQSQIQYNLALAYQQEGKADDAREAMERFRALKEQEEKQFLEERTIQDLRLQGRDALGRNDFAKAIGIFGELTSRASHEPSDSRRPGRSSPGGGASRGIAGGVRESFERTARPSRSAFGDGSGPRCSRRAGGRRLLSPGGRPHPEPLHMKRARRAILLSVVSVVGCHAAPEKEAPRSRAPRPLILITIDTLRSDYVGYSGSGKVKTPNLDRLAREGVYFTETRSPVPLTLPAHASILTGEVPPAHGVRVNGRDRLSEKETTLAEILKAKGYTTAAFVGAFVLDHRFGLDQGFDVYDDDLGGDATGLERIDAERDASSVASAFIDWLGSQSAERPFFAWLHFYDPHAPYLPPEPYRSAYPTDPYAGEVAYTDAVVGRVVDALRSRGLLEHALVAVVGDHGEGLGEHGEQTHAVLIYNSALHVPLLFYAPGLIEAGRKVDTVTRTVDVASTVLDYLGLPPPSGQGKTLRPLIEDRAEKSERDRPVYSESLYARVHLGWSELRALEHEGFRYIEAPRPELYDIGADPGELRNVLLSRKALAREMRQELERLQGELEKNSSHESAAIDAEAEARLKSLGYVSSSSTGQSSRTRSRGNDVDPKDKMELWNQIQLGVHDLGLRNYDAAREILEKILATEKEVPIVYENLGEAYMHLGREADAERIDRQALARGLEEAAFHVNLGRIHLSRRELAAAEKELRVALALDPENVTALVHLGNTLRAAGRPEEALSSYQQALAIDPRYLYAFDGLGRAYSQLDRPEESLRAFQQVVRLDPEAPQGYFNLAVQLEHMGRKAQALDAYQELLRRAPKGSPSELTRRASEAVERLHGKAPPHR